MIKCASFPDKTFASKVELFACLLENQDRIIQLKKAAVQKSCDKGQLGTFELLKITEETKSLLNLKTDYAYPVINTTNYMDGHDDVHFNGIWDKSAKEQAGKIFYVTDHSLKVSDVIAWPEDVEVMIKEVPWSFVGKSFEGNTQALIYGIPKEKIVHPQAKSVIEEKRPVQNSVRMEYVTIKLAINDAGKEFKAQKEYFDSKIEAIANKEHAIEQGYFWGVEEAKIRQEGSMVLFGSNDATPIKIADAVEDTSETEPLKSTQSNDEVKKFTFLKTK